MTKFTRFLVATILAAAGTAPALAQHSLGPAISYQGTLNDGPAPFDGTASMTFELWDQPEGGSVIGTVEPDGGVAVDNGLFSVELDFGFDAFNGEERWLQITVNGVALTPRQRVAAAPYSLQTRGLRVDDAGTVRVPGHFAVLGNGPLVNPGGSNSVLNLQTAPSPYGPIASLVFSDEASGTGWILAHHRATQKLRLTPYGSQPNIFTVPILEIRGGADISEPFNVNVEGTRASAGADSPVQPGMIVAIDPDRIGELRICHDPYDSTVAGIISGAGGVATGMTLRQEGTIADGEHPVALTGRVWALCDADINGSIRAGDLLTSSSTPGHAMKVCDAERAHGAIIGKAMSSLDSGKGLVLVLVSLQ
ncbi:MAG: hypothetical protein ACF8LK_10015 [Phycisphaerales bacterium JB041]